MEMINVFHIYYVNALTRELDSGTAEFRLQHPNVKALYVISGNVAAPNEFQHFLGYGFELWFGGNIVVRDPVDLGSFFRNPDPRLHSFSKVMYFTGRGNLQNSNLDDPVNRDSYAGL